MELLGMDLSVLFISSLAIIVGTIYGLFIGALLGLGATVGIALLLPVTYTLDPLPAILLLVAVYQSAEYSNISPSLKARLSFTKN